MQNAPYQTRVSFQQMDPSNLRIRSMGDCASSKTGEPHPDIEPNRTKFTGYPDARNGLTYRHVATLKTEVRYEPVSAGDIPLVIGFRKQAIARTRGADSEVEAIETNRIPIPWKSWMALADGIPVGAFVVWHDPEKGEQHDLLVSMDDQNRGIASGLIQRALSSPLVRNPRERFCRGEEDTDAPLRFTRFDGNREDERSAWAS